MGGDVRVRVRVRVRARRGRGRVRERVNARHFIDQYARVLRIRA